MDRFFVERRANVSHGAHNGELLQVRYFLASFRNSYKMINTYSHDQ